MRLNWKEIHLKPRADLRRNTSKRARILSISGTYTVLIFDLPFEIGTVEYSAFIHVEANPDPVEVHLRACRQHATLRLMTFASLRCADKQH